MATNKNLSRYNGTREAALPLISLDDAKQWLGILSSETKYDFQLNILIENISQEFEQFIDGPIIIANYDEIHDGNLSDTIVPQNKPIRSIKHVIMDTEGKFENLGTDALRQASPLRIPDDNYYLRDDGSLVLLDGTYSFLGASTTSYNKGSILIQYEAGYAESMHDMPADIKYAALVRLEQLYLLKQNRGYNVTQKRAGDSSQTIALGMPKEVEDILIKYQDCSFHKSDVRIRKFYTF